MKKRTILAVALLALLVLTSCTFYRKTADSPKDQGATRAAESQVTIGGQPVVILTRPAATELSKPHFLSATVLPGRGMNLLQLKAYLPGKGQIDVIHSPSLGEAKQYLDNQDDEWGNNAFKTGTAVLLPWVNRVRGKLSPDGKNLEVAAGKKLISIPANWAGGKPGAERHAIHGLVLGASFHEVVQLNGADDSRVSGVLHAGDFGGHWPSQTDVSVETVLRNDALETTITVKNVGSEPLPMGIGYHPYFNFPSGDRKQVRLSLPAEARAVVNNYDDVFPTGKLVPVKGTPYDFTAVGGKPLGDLFMDDNFPKVKQKPDGSVVVEIVDPAAGYGVRMTSLSREVKALQVYAPTDKNFIAVEPQFNWNDPFNKVWGKNDTGMVMLQPGESTTYRVRFELFVPVALSANAK